MKKWKSNRRFYTADEVQTILDKNLGEGVCILDKSSYTGLTHPAQFYWTQFDQIRKHRPDRAIRFKKPVRELFFPCLDHRDFVSRMEELGVKIISGEFKNLSSLFLVEDPEFGIRTASADTLLKRKGLRDGRRSQKEVELEIESLSDGMVRLAPPFKNTHAPLRLIDREFGEFSRSLSHFRKRPRHPKFFEREREEKRKRDISDIIKNIDFLSLPEKFETRGKFFLIKDEQFGPYWTTISNLKKGKFCKKRRADLDLIRWKHEGIAVRDLCEKHGVPYSTVKGHLSSGRLESNDVLEFLASHEPRTTLIESKLATIEGCELWNRHCGVGSFRPDIRVSENFYIEADGLFWHSVAARVQNKYIHLEKRKAFNSSGKKIFQFREDEIHFKFDIVKSIVENQLGRSEKLNARNLRFARVSWSEARDFLDRNHLMGSGAPTAQNLALLDGSEIVSLLTIRNNEIVRFANRIGSTVRGGFSRLLSKSTFEGYSQIYSWVDMRYSTGCSLEAAGFILQSEILSWRWTDGKNTFSRHRCKAGSGKTEFERASELGWFKIYDAGQRKYVKDINS